MDRDILHCTIIKAFALMDAFDVANAPKTRPHSIRTERESQKRGIPERNINLPGTSAMENNERLVVIMGCGSRPLRALSNGSTSPLWDKQGGQPGRGYLTRFHIAPGWSGVELLISDTHSLTGPLSLMSLKMFVFSRQEGGCFMAEQMPPHGETLSISWLGNYFLQMTEISSLGEAYPKSLVLLEWSAGHRMRANETLLFDLSTRNDANHEHWKKKNISVEIVRIEGGETVNRPSHHFQTFFCFSSRKLGVLGGHGETIRPAFTPR